MDLHIHPLARTLEVRPGANLLEVLREHHVPVSYSCMSGRCGTCRCKVVSGQVLDAGQDAIRPDGQGERYVLACQATLTESCAIEIPEPDEVVVHPARILKATVTGIDVLTHDIRRLRLKPNKPLEFSPGQYAQLQFAPDLARPYSMAGLSRDAELEFHVRKVPGGRVTAHIFEQLKLGDSVRVSGPLGTAYLRTKHRGPMLCAAGGTGLAPILSIVRGAIAAGHDAADAPLPGRAFRRRRVRPAGTARTAGAARRAERARGGRHRTGARQTSAWASSPTPSAPTGPASSTAGAPTCAARRRWSRPSRSWCGAGAWHPSRRMPMPSTCKAPEKNTWTDRPKRKGDPR
jgi:ferredoxin